MSTPFTVYSNKTIDVSQIVTGNGTFVADITPEFNNSGGYNSITIHIKFKNTVPFEELGSPGWNILAILESSDGSGIWYPIGQMMEPIRFLAKGALNIITVQPNVFNINEGVPVDIFDGNQVTTRISRQQGILGDDYRLRFLVTETKFGTADALQSFTMDVTGIRYNY